jgi:16S rRNA (guanine(966)-N(2))-methyltransferase RsmD
MRIIAGEFRGRTLLSPEGEVTRPITDRAKQSLFDVLSPRLEDARVYDCFAGTGSMGLESLSRDARAAVFFESDKPALKNLRQNIRDLKLTGRATVVSGDIFRYFRSAPPPEEKADLVFLDPPYRFVTEKAQELSELAEKIAIDHLADGGIVIFRHDSTDRLELPRLARYDSRDYGGMTIELLQAADADEDDADDDDGDDE